MTVRTLSQCNALLQGEVSSSSLEVFKQSLHGRRCSKSYSVQGTGLDGILSPFQFYVYGNDQIKSSVFTSQKEKGLHFLLIVLNQKDKMFLLVKIFRLYVG